MLYRCLCKGTNREVSEPRYSHNWVAAKRGIFKVFADRVECGAWTIPFSEITRAHLYWSKQMFIPVKILHIMTSSGSYQFGFNPWAHPERYLRVAYEESKIKLKYSLFSVVVRIIFLSSLLYWAWHRWLRM